MSPRSWSAAGYLVGYVAGYHVRVVQGTWRRRRFR